MKIIIPLFLLIICLTTACREDVNELTETTTETTLIEEYEYYLRAIDQNGIEEVFVNCKARKTKDETLITAVDQSGDNIILMGIKGFDQGSFQGNVMGIAGSLDNGVKDQSTMKIEKYDDKGGEITGSFTSGSIIGDFVAERIR